MRGRTTTRRTSKSNTGLLEKEMLPVIYKSVLIGFFFKDGPVEDSNIMALNENNDYYRLDFIFWSSGVALLSVTAINKYIFPLSKEHVNLSQLEGCYHHHKFRTCH